MDVNFERELRARILRNVNSILEEELPDARLRGFLGSDENVTAVVTLTTQYRVQIQRATPSQDEPEETGIFSEDEWRVILRTARSAYGRTVPLLEHFHTTGDASVPEEEFRTLVNVRQETSTRIALKNVNANLRKIGTSAHFIPVSRGDYRRIILERRNTASS